MGLFDFLKGAGKKVKQGQEADDIKRTLNLALGDRLTGLNVAFSNGTAKLFGQADSHATRQKAVLLAGNHDGVERVDDSGLTVAQAAKPADEASFYTIEKGDTLSGIAKKHYGDANRWRDLFEANKEVIDDPDKIYPGQTIRIPKA